MHSLIRRSHTLANKQRLLSPVPYCHPISSLLSCSFHSSSPHRAKKPEVSSTTSDHHIEGNAKNVKDEQNNSTSKDTTLGKTPTAASPAANEEIESSISDSQPATTPTFPASLELGRTGSKRSFVRRLRSTRNGTIYLETAERRPKIYIPKIPEAFYKLNYLRREDNHTSLDLIGYPIQQSVLDEIVYTVRASLVSTRSVDSMPARQENLLLTFPHPGATKYLDTVVKGVVKEVGADLLMFDTQDLMPLLAPIFDSKWTHPTWPLLLDDRGFNPHLSTPFWVVGSSGNNADEDEYTDRELDDEEEDAARDAVQPHGHHDSPYGHPVRADQFSTQYITQSKEFEYCAMRMSQFCSTLISHKSISKSAPKVIYFRDYDDLFSSSIGTLLTRGLVDAVQSRRRNGQRIMIVAGYSPSLLAEQAGQPAPINDPATRSSFNKLPLPPSGMKFIQKSVTIPTFTSINIPPPTLPAQGSPEGLQSFYDRLKHEQEARILEINARNIHTVSLKKGVELVSTDPKDIQCILSRLAGISTEIWGFHQVHRVVSNAIGYAVGLYRGDAIKVLLDMEHFLKAQSIIALNDEHRKNVARLLTGNVENSAVMNTNEIKVHDDLQLLEKIKGDATIYERPLLSRVVDPNRMQDTFKDIRAPYSTVETLQTLVTLPLIRPDLFSYGILKRNFISGLLLFGPPGTGKTLLAKAVAKESGARMLEIQPSDIYNMYIGESEQYVKAVFSLARKLSPCVVFLDEVDAILNARSSDGAKHSAQRDVINQFMSEWDGLTSSNHGVLVMAATNRPFDLDDAALRRMPRRVMVDLPSEADREHILQIHLRDEVLDPSILLLDVARRTPFYSGSDLKNLCVAAALAAVREAAHEDLAEIQQGKPPQPLSSVEGQKPPVPKRIIQPHHIAHALTQITASSSENMQSLVELRKWDIQYGDGANIRKKKSLGIGFGAEEPAPTTLTV